MRRVGWSKRALDDYDRLIDFLSMRDAHATELIARRIDEAAERLGRVATGRPGRMAGTYEKPVAKTSHIIVYAMTDNAIDILRIIHMARDWPPGAWPHEHDRKG